MGFLKKFIKNTFRDGQTNRGHSSFENVSEDQLEKHLKVAAYDGFALTEAVRPSFDLQVIPRAGFRHDKYIDERTGVAIPVLMASASREDVFDLFLDLLDPIGSEVDVVLETSHEKHNGRHEDLYREHIDLPILKSTLYDFEEMLLNDGCTGIAVLNSRIPVEVQFDEHKLLIIYGHDLSEFESVLEQHGLERDDELKFITEAEHVHSSSDEFSRLFGEMRYRLGIDDC
ncbi:MAG: hypothetical protein DWI21_08595 [Planctomycetota bacterium]|nr:MAG: hypothetical protein DWI21_08595 [Planctomycetota bacterium]GDY09256.1 hypothetical protein LBMAG52_27420 [Planctomycetia bacterium]